MKIELGTIPIADGKIYFRTRDGCIACYDLRKPKP